MRKYAKEVGNASMANAAVVKVVSGLFIVIFPFLLLSSALHLYSCLKSKHSMKLLTQESLEAMKSPLCIKTRISYEDASEISSENIILQKKNHKETI
jgi:hypothetical protein